MKTIKAKINLALFCIMTLTVTFGYKAYQTNSKMERIQERVSHSLSLRDKVKELNAKKKDIKILKRLKSHKSKLIEDDRRHALSNIIQAYNSNNPRLLSSRVDQFEKEEKNFFRVASWAIKKYKKEAQFYLSIAFLLPLFGLCGMLYYLNFGILSPLQTLSNRMMDFLLDQYTFHFSSPPNNEIGNLERTFNSLAQKVLNNLDELVALDRAKSEFVSIASHELRTPLTSIKGSLGLLSNNIVGSLDQEAKNMVSVAENETDRLVRIINEMLDLAKIESRSLTLNKEWILLSELFEKTTLGLHGFATASQVRLEVKNFDLPIQAMIDGDRIQQILTNLISNAIKYSPKDGVVTIATSQKGDGSLEISITDQGQGISEENQSLIFEKFRQATDSSNHLVKGTGLGLAISKALIEEHQGTIGVRSKLNQGSTFYFTLPEWKIQPKEEQQDKTSQGAA